MNKSTILQNLKKRFDFLQRLNLLGALLLAVAAAGIIVSIAYWLYWNNPNRKYDLARPGAKDNQALRVQDEEVDTTTPVTEEATVRKINFLEKEIKALNNISKFDPEDLSDSRIKLTPENQPLE